MHRREVVLVGCLCLLSLGGCDSIRPQEEGPRVVATTSLPIGTRLPYLSRASGQQATPSLSYVSGTQAMDTLWFSPLNSPLDAELIASDSTWFVNWADIPKVVPYKGSEGQTGYFAHVLPKAGAGTYEYQISLLHNQDLRSGAMRMSRVLHEHAGAGEHGFASYTAAEDSMHVFWLDGRATIQDSGLHAHGGGMQLRSRTVAYTGGFGEEKLIDALVCDCCPTSAAMTSHGPIVVYRDRSQAEIRDIYRALPHTSLPPAPIHVDAWQIAGCPVNGPSVVASPSTGDTVAVAWYTQVDGEAKLQLAWSTDGGINFGAPQTFGQPSALGRVTMTWFADAIALTYLSQPKANGKAGVRVELRKMGSTPVAQLEVAEVAANRSSGIPQLSAFRDTLFVAYTAVDTDEQVQVQLAKVAF